MADSCYIEKIIAMKKNLHKLVVGCFLTATAAFAQCPTPRADEIQTLCTGAKVHDLVASVEEGATVNYFFVGFILQPVAGTAEIIDGGRYAISQTVNGCTSGSANVVANLVEAPPQPGGDSPQEFTTGENVSGLTITTIENTEVKWYIRNDASQYIQIERSTLLEDGVTYYVTQSNGNCESAYHPITVHQVLGTANPSFKNLSVYPNPSANVITVSNSESISQITVSNLLGQRVLSQKSNASVAQVNIAALTAGTYLLQVHTAKGIATAKVIKQ